MQSILVPYFVFSLLSFVYWWLIEAKFRPMPDRGLFEEWMLGVDVVWQQFMNILVACNGEKAFIYNVVLWFLPCLFACHLIYGKLSTCKSGAKIGGIAVVLLYQLVRMKFQTLPWYVDVALVSVPFLIFGDMTYTWIRNKISITWTAIAMLVVSTVLFILFKSVSGMTLDMYSGNIPSMWWLYTIPIFGYMMIYCVSWLIGEHCTRLKNVFAWLGMSSLLIMCLHEPIKRIVIKAMAVIMHSETETIREMLLPSVAITIVTILLCLPLIVGINRYLPWMIGKRYR